MSNSSSDGWRLIAVLQWLLGKLLTLQLMHLHRLSWSHRLVLSVLLSGMTESPLKFNLICQYCVLNMMLSCSAVLAHIILNEKLHIFGILGCALCVVGSITIVLHAPQEREIESVIEVWNLATEPGTLFP